MYNSITFRKYIFWIYNIPIKSNKCKNCINIMWDMILIINSKNSSSDVVLDVRDVCPVLLLILVSTGVNMPITGMHIIMSAIRFGWIVYFATIKQPYLMNTWFDRNIIWHAALEYQRSIFYKKWRANKVAVACRNNIGINILMITFMKQKKDDKTLYW